MRETKPLEKQMDESYLRRAPLWHRLVIICFRRQINVFVKIVLSRAFERSQIDSFTYHELCGIVDRMLWPSSDNARNKVVQKNNVCGGDMAGRDIINRH